MVTICPPAGTNAINMTVLAHIPDANIIVVSAPSSALYHHHNNMASISIHRIDCKHKRQALNTKENQRKCKPDLLLDNHCRWISIPPVFKTCCAFLLQQGKRTISQNHHRTSNTSYPIHKTKFFLVLSLKVSNFCSYYKKKLHPKYAQNRKKVKT